MATQKQKRPGSGDGSAVVNREEITELEIPDVSSSLAALDQAIEETAATKREEEEIERKERRRHRRLEQREREETFSCCGRCCR